MDGWRGVSILVDEAEVFEDDIAKLKAALIKFIEQRPDNPSVGSAIWTLGKFGDVSLRGFFLTELRRHHEAQRVHPMTQVVAVLEVIDDISIYDFAPGETAESEGYREAVGVYLRRNPDTTSNVSSGGV